MRNVMILFFALPPSPLMLFLCFMRERERERSDSEGIGGNETELSGMTSSPHQFPSLQVRSVLLHHTLPLLGHLFDFFQFLVYVVHATVGPYVDRIVELASVGE